MTTTDAHLCPCSKRHSPPITMAETDVHHAPPQSYPLAPGAVRKTVRICVTCHRRCHRLLNLYVHAYIDTGEPPPESVLRGFKPFERELAVYAWANADHSGPGHLPYTLNTGEMPHAAETR